MDKKIVSFARRISLLLVVIILYAVSEYSLLINFEKIALSNIYLYYFYKLSSKFICTVLLSKIIFDTKLNQNIQYISILLSITLIVFSIYYIPHHPASYFNNILLEHLVALGGFSIFMKINK